MKRIKKIYLDLDEFSFASREISFSRYKLFLPILMESLITFWKEKKS